MGSIACVFTLLHFGLLGYFRAVQRTIAINLLSLVGTLLSLVIVLVLLRHGLSLYALAVGMLARSIWLLASSIIYFLLTEGKWFLGRTLYDTTICREMIKAAPATALGVLGSAVMNSSDALVVGMMVGNVSVPAYSFTKKAAEAIRAILDMVAFAAYPGFAHLVGSEQRRKAAEIYRDIMTIFVLMSVCGAVGYVTTNEMFVGYWVGIRFYLGPAFTVLFGLQMILSSGSMLVNYLYRSTGYVVTGSLIFALEAVIKLSMVCIGCYLLGGIGVPLASVIISLIFIIINRRLTLKEIGKGIEMSRGRSFSNYMVPIICILVGIVYQHISKDAASWYRLGGGMLVTVVSAAMMLLFMRDARILMEDKSYKAW